MAGFRNHTINSFNSRWEEFDIGSYLLAYFLHPAYRSSGIKIGQYRNIVKAAGVIWKNLGKNQNSVEMLFSKMRQYKSNLPPYDVNYVMQNDTPRIWWNTIDDNDNCLQKLALLILDITPHNAECERIFFNLGWIYGKKRLRLSLPKVEGMAKVRSYYMSMINKELKYFKEDCDVQELTNKHINN